MKESGKSDQNGRRRQAIEHGKAHEPQGQAALGDGELEAPVTDDHLAVINVGRTNRRCFFSNPTSSSISIIYKEALERVKRLILPEFVCVGK